MRYGRRRYYPGDSSEIARKLIAVNEHDGQKDVLDAVLDGGEETTVSGIAKTIDRDASTVSHHLNRLESDALVERSRDGRTVTISLNEAWTDAIKEFLR